MYSTDPRGSAKSTFPCSTGKHSGNIHLNGSPPSRFLLFGFISHYPLTVVMCGHRTRNRTVGGVFISPPKHTHKHTNNFLCPQLYKNVFSARVHSLSLSLSLSFILNPLFICFKCAPRTPIPTWGARHSYSRIQHSSFITGHFIFDISGQCIQTTLLPERHYPSSWVSHA